MRCGASRRGAHYVLRRVTKCRCEGHHGATTNDLDWYRNTWRAQANRPHHTLGVDGLFAVHFDNNVANLHASVCGCATKNDLIDKYSLTIETDLCRGACIEWLHLDSQEST
jgi:hypothetical protein